MEHYLLFLLIVNAIMFANSTDFTFAVLGNPQAFQLPNGEGNPNSEKVNGEKWMRINKNVVRVLHSLPTISFAIVNGDLTESGNKKSWQKVLQIYDFTKFVFFFGIGDHDYESNIGNCRRRSFLSSNGCAIESISQMRKLLALYKKEQILNFRKDLVGPGKIRGVTSGSLSYSWDYENVHFVQLQNYPIYTAELKYALLGMKVYSIKKSLSWLADDLRLAKLRNISDIVINFHQRKKFQEDANHHDKKYFQAIMTTYKPLVIFSGLSEYVREEEFNDEEFFVGTKVYETGAAFDGKFFLVKYINASLSIEVINGKFGKLEKLKEYAVQSKSHTPLCILEGTDVEDPQNKIFATSFFPVNSKEINWWHLQHALGSLKILSTNEQGQVYLSDWDPLDENLWSFQTDRANKQPVFIEWYWIRNKGTGLVLTSDRTGKVSTQKISLLNTLQQWRLLKGKDSQVMLLNRGTERFLHSTKGGIVTANPGFNMANQNKVWEVSNISTRDPLQNVRYYEALLGNSLTKPFPNQNESNPSWKYLGSHDYLQSPPCIGW